MEIAVDRLGKRYQHGWVFRNLSFLFQSNNIYGISGRNGSGKSTFLKIISGLLSATEGKIQYVSGQESVKREDIYQYLSVAAPYTELLEEFTLAEMIDFHTGFKPSDRFSDTAQWIEMMQLGSAAHRPMVQFSSGMKQRVKLGLALYSKAEIIFLDEPTSNLDENAKDWFFQHLDLQRQNKLIFIASNEEQDFKFCAERILL